MLNRTGPVSLDGSWLIRNIPAGFGPVRARATCVKDGKTVTGESEPFIVPPNGVVNFPKIIFGRNIPIPERLTIASTPPALTGTQRTAQLAVTAIYPGGTTADVTRAAAGTVYTSSNPAIASVSADGLVTGATSGAVVIQALNEGAGGMTSINVVLSTRDTDGDGINDDVELTNGLDPNNPVDAQEDTDRDGLSNRDELTRGTDLRNPDSDGDGLRDGDEVARGTNPLLADSDGDGIPDALEVTKACNPLVNDLSACLPKVTQSFTVTPSSFALTVNSILPDASQQLAVRALLLDGRTTLDLTSRARGTNYASSNLAVCNFDAVDGRVRAGTSGACTITITNGSLVATASGIVRSFNATQLSYVDLPGFVNNVDVQGNYAYVAAGTAGMVVVDVADRTKPLIVRQLGLAGDAKDVVVQGNLGYVAGGAAGLHILDISNPLNPVLRSTFAIPGGAEDVVVRSNRAFVAAGKAGLYIVDVTNPASPVLTGQRGLEGVSLGVDVDAVRNVAVVAAGGTGFHVVNIANPASPVLLKTERGGDVRDVVLSGNYAFLADYSRSFTSVNLTDPSNPVVVASTPRSTGGLLEDVAVFGRWAVGADVFFVNGVPVIDVNNPADPQPRTIVNFTARDDDGTGIAIDSFYVYLTANKGSGRLYIGQYTALQDTRGIPPTVSMTSPKPGELIKQGSTITVNASATDDAAVAGVTLFANGANLGTKTAAPYSWNYKVTSVGSITFAATALDYGANAASASVTITSFTIPPTVSITAPTAGDSILQGSTITLRANATDDLGVAGVTFFANGVNLGTVTAAPYFWNYTVTSVGSITFAATALDYDANTTSASVTVTSNADPLTTVTGRVIDSRKNPVAGVSVTVFDTVVPTTAVDGRFSIPNVSTVLGDIQALMLGTIGGRELRGRSNSKAPSRGGLTDLGDVIVKTPGFFPAELFPTGSHPYSVAVGDFNGDGRLDVVTANYGSSDVSVLLGNGNGTFQPQQRFAVGSFPSSVAIGDFNGDGRLDFVAANEDSSDVSVLLGNGNGTFQPQQRFAVGSLPFSVAVGDFNGDGRLDVVTANRFGDDVSMLLGNGNGTLQAPQRFVVGSAPSSVAVGDFNGDGRLDVVTANRFSNDVSMLMGNGNGTFQSPQRFAVGSSPSSVAVADFNGDGRSDLTVANARSGDISVLLGNGNGTFQMQQRIAVGSSPYSVAVGDCNGDGRLDVVSADVVSTSGASSSVSVLLGNGNGTFQPQQRFPTGANATFIAVGDFNGDEGLDVVTVYGDSEYDNSNDVVLLLGNGNGTFQAQQNFPVGSLPFSAVVGDFNGDGRLDVVTANRSSNDVSMLLGNGNGTFQGEQRFVIERTPVSAVKGDFNGDGRLDLVTANGINNDVSMLLGNGNGMFQAPQHFALGSNAFSLAVSSLAVGDFNGDGRLDVVTANRGSNDVSVLLGNGNGTFQAQRRFVAVGVNTVAVGDFDRDGRLDIVTANVNSFDMSASTDVSVLLGDGNGTFQPQQRFAVGSSPSSVAVGDFNGDGRPDVVTANAYSNDVSVLLGNGNGTFQPQQRIAVWRGAFQIEIGDFNGDGRLDLVTCNSSDVSVLLGNGDGTFQAQRRFASVGVSKVAVGDFDKDGRLDIVLSSSNRVSLLLQQ